MKVYIYKITNNINGKIYIGQHREHTKKLDGYLGSGILIKKAQNKYGKENFSKEIIEYCSRENVNDREIYWIKYYNSITPNGYNIQKGGKHVSSTQDTKVYNNGKRLKYIRKGETPPKGYIKGSLDLGLDWRRSCSKKRNKGIIPWNKGKRIDNESVKKNSEHSRKTIIEQGILRGANNPRAKTYEIISPKNEKFIVVGGIKQFCKEHNLSYKMVKKYKNQGPCLSSKYNNSKNGENTVGWIFNIIETNDVEEARNNRNKTYKKLYFEGKLSKRQQNINKLEQFLDIDNK